MLVLSRGLCSVLRSCSKTNTSERYATLIAHFTGVEKNPSRMWDHWLSRLSYGWRKHCSAPCSHLQSFSDCYSRSWLAICACSKSAGVVVEGLNLLRATNISGSVIEHVHTFCFSQHDSLMGPLRMPNHGTGRHLRRSLAWPLPMLKLTVDFPINFKWPVQRARELNFWSQPSFAAT